MKKRIFKMLSLGIKQFSDPYYQGFAAQLSFYFILSLVPIVLLISQLLGFFLETSIQDAVGWLLNYVEGEVADQMEQLLSYRSAGATNIVFFVIALWASSRAQFSMMRITNFTFTDGKSTGRGYWRERFRAVRTMGFTLLVIIVALVVLVYGGKLLELLTNNASLWLIIRWPVALALYFMMISYNYYMLPSDKVKFREIIPGSIFASVGLLLVTVVYSKYTGTVASYDILYGSLATVVALMFWFYFLAWVLCLGVLFNKVWMDTEDSTN
ncbi:MAG: YihY/virulence factor BrkB family protein [Anaerovoracaceae bacterium]